MSSDNKSFTIDFEFMRNVSHVNKCNMHLNGIKCVETNKLYLVSLIAPSEWESNVFPFLEIKKIRRNGAKFFYYYSTNFTNTIHDAPCSIHLEPRLKLLMFFCFFI